jgi:hypothetical protein
MPQIVRQTMSRHDDARSLLRAVYSTEIDLIPDQEANSLTVRLHPLANTSSDQALKHLCAEITATEPQFRGTELRLTYELVSASLRPGNLGWDRFDRQVPHSRVFLIRLRPCAQVRWGLPHGSRAVFWRRIGLKGSESQRRFPAARPWVSRSLGRPRAKASVASRPAPAKLPARS